METAQDLHVTDSMQHGRSQAKGETTATAHMGLYSNFVIWNCTTAAEAIHLVNLNIDAAVRFVRIKCGKGDFGEHELLTWSLT